MKFTFKLLSLAVISNIILLASCSKKDNPNPNTTSTTTTTTTTTTTLDTSGTLKANSSAVFPNMGFAVTYYSMNTIPALCGNTVKREA